MTTHEAPVDDLFRGLTDGLDYRADDGDADDGLMYGHFSVFDDWYEIDSWFEGNFLERVAPGAFKKTIREHRDSLVVQFDHGYDINVGDSPLGDIRNLHEDETGPYYEVDLYDTDYNRDRILPLLQGRTLDGRKLGSALGASFRFRVTRDEWVEPDKPSDHNPDKIKERTIREVRLYEFGPVVFPANPSATAAARSLSDHYIARRLEREGRAERAARSILGDAATPGTSPEPPVAPAVRHPTGPSPRDIRAFLTLNKE